MATTITTDLLLDQTAYDLFAYFALRPELYFDAVADVKPTNQSMPGAAVKFEIISDLSIASTAINESTDITPASMADSQVTATLAEYGNAVKTTALVRGTSYVPVNPIVANIVGFNAGQSLDEIASIVLRGGSNVRYATGGTTDPTARNTVQPEDVLAGDDARRARADLVGANVQPIGGSYVGYIHPDVAYDFRAGASSVNSAAWRDPHVYSQPAEIWSGEIGQFEGIRWVETPRAPVFADAGSSTTPTDVYATIVVGRQALAKAYSYTDGNGAMPKIVPGPVTDTLRRFVPLGWYWLGAYARFREAALRRIESSSSIGTNA